VELGVYDIMIGRSSADIQVVAAVTFDGETIPSRNPRQLTRAENFDDYHGALLVDETRTSGTAVGATALGDWIAFQDVDFGGGVSEFVASVANDGASIVGLEIRLDSPDGTLIGAIQAPVTGSRYDWATTTASVSGATGTHDVYLVSGGAMRIRTFQFRG
jgi:beta-glucosidase